MKLNPDFHKWAFSKELRVQIIDGKYTDIETEMFWECWQAAHAQGRAEGVAVVEELVKTLKHRNIPFAGTDRPSFGPFYCVWCGHKEPEHMASCDYVAALATVDAAKEKTNAHD